MIDTSGSSPFEDVAPPWGRRIRACFAEGSGVFLFVFILISVAAVTAYMGDSSGLLGIALAHGAAFALAIATTQHVSLGHLNPALTLSELAMGRIKALDAFGYVVAQCVGALLAALFAEALLPREAIEATHLSVAVAAPVMQTSSVFAIELILGIFIAYSYVSSRRSASPLATPLTLGLVVFLGFLAAAPLTGASMNPARALGPALVSGLTDGLWIPLIAPPIGALLGSFAAQALQSNESGLQRPGRR